jgi:hypothetical protein
VMKLSTVGTLITAILTLGFLALGQSQDRVVHVLSGNCPATIINLKVASMAIEAQRPFVAPEGWLQDLSWEVENTSENQLISYIEFALHFHELGAASEASVFKLGYGQPPGQASPLGKIKLLLPGQTTKVTFSEEDYQRLRIFVEKKRPVGELQVVEVKVSAIAFDDHSFCPAKGKP